MQRTRRCFPFVVAVVVVMAVVSTASTPVNAATVTPHGSRAGLFCPCWGTPPATDAAWDDAARNLSLIAASAHVLGSRYARLHQVNPNIVAIPYNVGPYLSNKSEEYANTLRDHPDRFARDSNGKLISVPSFPNLYLMDLMNAGWRQQMTGLVAAAASRFDGVYVDSMGLAPVSGGYTTGKPADPLTRQNYSAAAWMGAARDTLNGIRSAVGSKYVMVNGLNNGTNYQQGSKTIVDAKIDGAMSEAWIRGAKAPVTSYPSASAFALELNEMADVQAKGKDFFAWTKTWSGGTAQQKADWNTFSFASFLLVNQGKGYYNFLPDETGDRSVVRYPVNMASIGSPLGSYSVTNGVYTRQFSNATVTVNPGAKTASIKLKNNPGPTTSTTRATGPTTTTRPNPTTTTTKRPTTTTIPPSTTTTTRPILCELLGCY